MVPLGITASDSPNQARTRNGWPAGYLTEIKRQLFLNQSQHSGILLDEEGPTLTGQG